MHTRAVWHNVCIQLSAYITWHKICIYELKNALIAKWHKICINELKNALIAKQCNYF